MADSHKPHSVDHTAIPIDVDPREQRMRGIAVHGRTPFDVPYISEIVPGLWQGGCADGLVLPTHIDHVVSLYPWERYTNRHQLKSLLSVALYDDVDQSTEQIRDIAAWVNACRRTGTVLVHCQAGLNRSALVVGAALLMGDYPGSPLTVVKHLRETRSPAVLCNPAFEAWLTGSEW